MERLQRKYAIIYIDRDGETLKATDHESEVLLRRRKFYRWMFVINVVLYGSILIFLCKVIDTPDKIAKPTIITIWVSGFVLSTWVTVIRPYLQIKKLLKNQ